MWWVDERRGMLFAYLTPPLCSHAVEYMPVTVHITGIQDLFPYLPARAYWCTAMIHSPFSTVQIYTVLNSILQKTANAHNDLERKAEDLGTAGSPVRLQHVFRRWNIYCLFFTRCTTEFKIPLLVSYVAKFQPSMRILNDFALACKTLACSDF